MPKHIIAKAQRGAALLIAILETLLAVILTLGVLVSSWKLVRDIMYLAEAEGFEKQLYLHLLDSALLLILAIDVTRTLLSAAIRGALPLRIVVEVAALAVLREIISIEIRNPGNVRILVYTVLFAVLALYWIILSGVEARQRTARLKGAKGTATGRETP